MLEIIFCHGIICTHTAYALTHNTWKHLEKKGAHADSSNEMLTNKRLVKEACISQKNLQILNFTVYLWQEISFNGTAIWKITIKIDL